MALDEDLDEQEMRLLLANKGAQVANGSGPFVSPNERLSRSALIGLTKRMAEIAQALPPELKN
jgi:hypothetical protein